ncbi:MAG TPA: hypothetical protein VN721_00275, partial [Flavipsychrobacter sp.]|nr:hypothetical protein [Flavipsychrobacter sp.]
FRGGAFSYTMFTVIMLFGQALYLNRIAIRHKLYGKPTYIPAFVYLLLTSIYPSFDYFSVALLINWCLLASVDILLRFSQTVNPRKIIFNAAYLLGLAFLLQFSAIGYLLLLLICMIILRPFNLGEWVVSILGYITPIYFFLAIVFLFDMLRRVLHFPHIDFLITSHSLTRTYLAGCIVGLSILFTAGLLSIQSQMSKINIYSRRNWIALSVYFIISVFVAVGAGFSVQSGWLLVMPPLAMIISYALSLEKSKRFSNFMFYFSLLFLVFCQLAYK